MSYVRIGLVVPCYNEERRLNVKSFLDELSKNTYLTVLFVDDGSTDGTLNVIQKICESMPERALKMSFDVNKGKAEAIREGMLYLLKKESFEIIGFWDADLAVSLGEIQDFLNIFEMYPEVKAVIGSRVHLAGRKIERVNMRHYFGRLFATAVCLTFSFSIYDTQCGAKLFYSDILYPAVSEPFCSGWIFDVELIIRLSRLKSLSNSKKWIYEVAVKEWKDVAGTKRSLSAYGSAFVDFIKLIRQYSFNSYSKH